MCACWPPPTRFRKTPSPRGQLRNDLYYRLNVFNIHMPPLREHKEDIPSLTETLIKDMNAKHQRNVRTASDAGHAACLRLLLAGQCARVAQHAWSAPSSSATPASSSRAICRPASAAIPCASPVSEADGIHVGVGTTVDEAERQLIVKTLESTHNNKTRAAEILGISLKTLHNKLKEYGDAGAGQVRCTERLAGESSAAG